MLKAVGEPQIICTLETKPLKITREIEARAKLIAASPSLLETMRQIVSRTNNLPCSGSECPYLHKCKAMTAEKCIEVLAKEAITEATS